MKEGKIKKTPHVGWKHYKQIPWPVAKCCGLVALNNDVTRKAIRAGCEK